MTHDEEIQFVQQKAGEWAERGGVGCFRAARALPGQPPMCGEDRVWKVFELPENVQNALAVLCAFCDSARIEITSIRGRPDHINAYRVV